VKRASLLLDVARMNATHQKLQVEDVDFAQVLREVVESYTAEAEFHQSSLTLCTPDSLTGRWERLGLEQIVSNLVSNAVKFGAGAPIEVVLGCETPETVRLEVRDAGIGIAPEDQSRIFGQFERVQSRRHAADSPPEAGDPAYRRTISGAGLGLWLVRELVKVHGGDIWVTSAPGQGATFTVRLPIDAGASWGRAGLSELSVSGVSDV
jgi:two-component system OmpR family sensor kinase